MSRSGAANTAPARKKPSVWGTGLRAVAAWIRRRLFGPPLGARVDPPGHFARVQVYRREEPMGPVYSVAFKNREVRKRGSFTGVLFFIFVEVPIGLYGILGFFLAFPFYWTLIFSPIAGEDAAGDIDRALAVLRGNPRDFYDVWAMTAPLAWLLIPWLERPVRRLRIELDQGRGELRVRRGPGVRKRLPPDLSRISVEEHEMAPVERIERQLQGQKRPGWKEKQRCLVGWFGYEGSRPETIVCRFEWPDRGSLLEVQQAVYFAGGALKADVEARTGQKAEPVSASDRGQPPREPLLPPRR